MIQKLVDAEKQILHFRKQKDRARFKAQKGRLRFMLENKTASLTPEQKTHFKNLLNLEIEA